MRVCQLFCVIPPGFARLFTHMFLVFSSSEILSRSKAIVTQEMGASQSCQKSHSKWLSFWEYPHPHLDQNELNSLIYVVKYASADWHSINPCVFSIQRLEFCTVLIVLRFHFLDCKMNLF